MNTKTTPELLAPAGSYAALEAAIEAGADAVYLGGSAFNARVGAENFDSSALSDAAALCRAYDVKLYVTLNTLIYDKELSSVLSYAEFLYQCGVDALIVADLGLSSLLRRYIPDLTLHASTQMSAHNSDAGHILKDLGFSRMVCARELSFADVKNIVQNSPIEIEMFVHGALCVSHSGQCLASSLVGQRSGNRGECAQPCRLPFRYGGNAKKTIDGYPLSLRDLCLAGNIEKILDSGVTSLKIEGRMKPPEYVFHAVSTYRRLLDERRNATRDEIKWLSRVFSRDGFTDGYFTGKPDKTMLGVRTEWDKQNSRDIPPFEGLRRKIPIKLKAVISAGMPSQLQATAAGQTIIVNGDAAETAINAPLTKETVVRNLSKLGNTPYFADKDSIHVNLIGNPMMRISSLNALRRSAVAQFLSQGDSRKEFRLPDLSNSDALSPDRVSDTNTETRFTRTAQFMKGAQIPPEAFDYFDIIYLPLDEYLFCEDKLCRGVILPPVILDSERAEVSHMLGAAAVRGATHALVGNLGHISIANQHGLVCHGDFRLNIMNSVSAHMATKEGLDNIILSPELSLPQIRDIPLPKSTIVYGRIPLMLLEKCVIRDFASCAACDGGTFTLKDRRGVDFPVVLTFKHRNIMLNSVPVYMADRSEILEKFNVGCQHFVFTIEQKSECRSIIDAYKTGRPSMYPQTDFPIRRIRT